MRYFKNSTITLSEDSLTSPKEIRFEDKDRETIETTSIVDGGGRTETIPDGTTDWEIPMGNIAAGKWFYLYSNQAFSLKIDNGTARVISASKQNEMWMEFTSLKISNSSGSDMRFTWAVGGA